MNLHQHFKNHHRDNNLTNQIYYTKTKTKCIIAELPMVFNFNRDAAKVLFSDGYASYYLNNMLLYACICCFLHKP